MFFQIRTKLIALQKKMQIEPLLQIFDKFAINYKFRPESKRPLKNLGRQKE